MKVPCKITLRGDKGCASHFVGAAQSQMRILENQMSFGNLVQAVRRVRLNPRVTVQALACFSLREVIIDCLPLKIGKKEERKGWKLIPRFFAYIVRVDAISGVQTREYMWIYFNNKDDSVDLSTEENTWTRVDINDTYEFLIRKTIDSRLERMKNTPRGDILHPNPHRNTKAFMMDGRTTGERADDLDEFGDPVERPERWVASGHSLTKDRDSVFMPLHAYTDDSNIQHAVVADDCYCDILDSAKYPDYPLPFPGTLFLAYDNIFFTGLQFPVPPRHFYCNTEEGIMVWYGTNIDYAYDDGDYIGGIIYSRRTQSFYKFMVYPTEANGKGYETCYAFFYANSELPQNLMADVQSLDDEYLTVAMSWNKRPIEYKFSLAAGNIITQEITSVTHTRWVEDNSGFEHQDFTEWTQFYNDPATVSYYEEDGPIYTEGDTAPCAEREGGVCQGFLDSELYKYSSGNRSSDNDNEHKHSDQTWDILGTEVKLVADLRTSSCQQRAFNKIAQCKTVAGNECGIGFHTYSKRRRTQERLWQQESDDYRGAWVGNNAVGFEYRKQRLYIDAEAWTHSWSYLDGFATAGYFPQCSGGACDYSPSEEQFENRCIWAKHCPPDSVGTDIFHYPCFYDVDGTEMKGDDWVAIDTDIIQHVPFNTLWEWLREADQDTYDYTVVDEFNVDGELTFSYSDVNNIYYLDDRATNENQGLIVAGRGLSATSLYTDDCTGAVEYKPDYWKIHWKVLWDDLGMEYLDITDKLLEALDCEDHELLDLGLI